MIKNILWDFDGVILDSMKIKGDGFVELFKENGVDNVRLVESYHYKNGGVSRFDKIKYFYSKILKKSIEEEEVLELADKFGKIIKQKINDKNNLIEDSMSFIRANYTKYNFHIVSGAEHKELKKLCESFEITKYFITIDGSPTQKDILVTNVMNKYNYKINETILIGDALTDVRAAKINNIKFYGYNNIKLKDFNYIDSFELFKDAL